MGCGALIVTIIVGAITGVVARFLVPGADPMGWLLTICLGIGGSFVGGFLGSALDRKPGAKFQRSGLVMSILGSVILLLAWRLLTH